MGKLKDLSGQRFGRYTVLDQHRTIENCGTQWLCRCDCGTEKWVYASNLRSGTTLSCGCLQRERAAETLAAVNTVHGGRGERLYKKWAGMKSRCYNPRHSSFKNYGGKGVTVCPEWRNDFSAFRSWAMENGWDENAPKGALTIDRKDNGKGYSPDNCRFVPLSAQSRNRSINRFVTYRGKEYLLADLARELGLGHGTLFNRIFYLHWPESRWAERPHVHGKKAAVQWPEWNGRPVRSGDVLDTEHGSLEVTFVAAWDDGNLVFAVDADGVRYRREGKAA